MGENEQKTNVAVQTLMNLGLTNCQARIYVALVLNGSCSADVLSKFSKVTRQDIYRILPKLQEIGLARKILDVPVEWEATSLKEGLTLLMDAQKKRYLGLQTQTTELLENFIVSNNKTENFPSNTGLKLARSAFFLRKELDNSSLKHFKRNWRRSLKD